MTKPYAKLKLWENVIEFLLLILTVVGILALITLKLEGDIKVWVDILINIGCSIITSIGLSIFIYFRYLKKIPDENRKQIEDLLDKRLSSEAVNHNAVLHQMTDDSRFLSSEHKEILTTVLAVKGKFDAYDTHYNQMTDGQKNIMDSIKSIEAMGTELMRLQAENAKYEKRIQKLEYVNRMLVKNQKSHDNYQGLEDDDEPDIGF